MPLFLTIDLLYHGCNLITMVLYGIYELFIIGFLSLPGVSSLGCLARF